eukprot:4695093-Prymnesium_polylepis.1
MIRCVPSSRTELPSTDSSWSPTCGCAVLGRAFRRLGAVGGARCGGWALWGVRVAVVGLCGARARRPAAWAMR